jgi:hypothetical protein
VLHKHAVIWIQLEQISSAHVRTRSKRSLRCVCELKPHWSKIAYLCCLRDEDLHVTTANFLLHGTDTKAELARFVGLIASYLKWLIRWND